MTFGIISLHNKDFQPLADITWNQNKVPYAELHGYRHFVKNHDTYQHVIGFEKIFFIREVMYNNPDIEWFWWVGCDTLLTNFTIRLEDRVDNRYHFIIATDCHGINADSFFIRNTNEGRYFINTIADKYDQYKSHYWAEQQVIIDLQEQFKHIIKIVPQRDINSYNYDLYPTCLPYDIHQNDGQWKSGDLLIHWPGTALEERLSLAEYYTTKIVK
jgi:hypothetical protein